jgi:hypothetical protein
LSALCTNLARRRQLEGSAAGLALRELEGTAAGLAGRQRKTILALRALCCAGRSQHHKQGEQQREDTHCRLTVREAPS